MKYQKRDLAVHFEQSSKPKRSKYIIQREREGHAHRLNEMHANWAWTTAKPL